MEEDDFESEVRIKKLVEDSFLQAEKEIQAEKENMAILQSLNNFNHKDTSHSVLKNRKSCPHFKSPLPQEQTGSFAHENDVHSRIHFLNCLQTSLLPTCNKRSIVNESKNKYIPCAIPLSPPIRLKRDADESVSFYESIQNNSLVHPPPIHTCGKSSSTISSERFPSVNACNKSLRNDGTLIEKNFPSAAINLVKENCTATTKRECNLRNFPSPAVNLVKENCTATTKRECNSRVKNVYPNTSVVFKDKPSHSKNDSFISNQKITVPNEIKITRTKQDEDLLKESQISESKLTKEDCSKDSTNRTEKNGFHLQISLDSCSASDAINKMLNKIPEIVNKFQAASNETKEISHSKEVKKEEEKKFSGIFSKPSKIISERQIDTVSSSTQTTNKSFRNINAFSRFSEKGNHVITSSTQTDKNEEDLPIKKHELHYMVKEIVLDTLKSIHIDHNLPTSKVPPTNQKVDSGIQTEEESDAPEHLIDEACCAGNLLKQHNVTEVRNYLSISKDVQVDVNISQGNQLKDVLEKSSAEIPNYSFEMLQEESVPSSYKGANSVNAIPERSSTPKEKSNIELMLEKIYEQVCKEKEAAKHFSDNQFINSVYTREVAVQFNPLHTSTKSTSTAEIKKRDTSCQYDILTEIYAKKSNIDASVQVEDYNETSDQKLEVVDAFTQYKKKCFSDAVIQTEVVTDSEHSATNTSACTTPVSESMFMDDMLSEGEIVLPWNLRLLSRSGGTTVISNQDYSDVSIKEKDYSLSEGEVHPSIVSLLNICPCSHNDFEDKDSQNDVYPLKFKSDSKPGTSTFAHFDKHGFTNACNQKLQISSSVLTESECNSNASLSLGEVSPSFFRAPLMHSTYVDEKHPSSSNDDKIKDNTLQFSSSDVRNASSHSVNFTSPENNAITEQNLKHCPDALQTVDEEAHAMYK